MKKFNMKTIQEQIEIMQHYANGGEVEYYNEGGSKRGIMKSTDAFDWGNYDYLIKKQKNTITIEKWLCEYIHSKHLEGSNRFFILEKAVPFEVHGEKIKLIEKYEVEL